MYRKASLAKVTALVKVVNYFHVAKFNGKFSVSNYFKKSVIFDTLDYSHLSENLFFFIRTPRHHTFLVFPLLSHHSFQPFYLVFDFHNEEFLLYPLSGFTDQPSHSFKNSISTDESQIYIPSTNLLPKF